MVDVKGMTDADLVKAYRHGCDRVAALTERYPRLKAEAQQDRALANKVLANMDIIIEEQIRRLQARGALA